MAHPLRPLAGQRGFSEREVEGEVWRVDTHVNEELGIGVMVGDALGMRERLVDGMAMSLLVSTILILPRLSVLIWFRGPVQPVFTRPRPAPRRHDGHAR